MTRSLDMKSLERKERHLWKAFTLIELLVVISIIGLLAALIVGLSGVAIKKARIARVQSELAQWEMLIENYKTKKGFYPPDNTTDPAVNPLFYELAGTIYTPPPPTPPYYQTLNGEFKITTNAVGSCFRIGGFFNAAQDKQEVVESYRSRKTSQYFEITTNGATIVVLGVPVDGAIQFADVRGKKFSPWQYVSSNPRNNPNSFDLWLDLLIGGKTNRICNWSKAPIVY